MPTIALIDGVRITIYARDHPPPHFHAKHAEFEALISIVTGDVLDGSLSRAKLKVVRAPIRVGSRSRSSGPRSRRAGIKEALSDEEVYNFERGGCALSCSSHRL
jgi:hypothetical protein